MDQPGETFLERVATRHDFEPDIREFEPGATPTAADAAAALDCPPAQVVASIVCQIDGDVVVALTSGANRVDLAALARVHGGETATLADPETVTAATGYSVGGVPPFGHDRQLPTYLDETLCSFEIVYPAAGTAARLFPIGPDRLVELASAQVASFAVPE